MGKNQKPAPRARCARVGVGRAPREWVAATHACRAWARRRARRAHAFAFGTTGAELARLPADDHAVDLTWTHGLFCHIGMNAALKANHLSSGASTTADDEAPDLHEDFVSGLRASAHHDADFTADLCAVLAEAGDGDESDRDFAVDSSAAAAADLAQASGESADVVLGAIRGRRGHGANDSPRGDAGCPPPGRGPCRSRGT